METFRVSGLEVQVDEEGKVYHRNALIGSVGREQRFDQFYWRAYDPATGEPYKRFFTARPDAIQLLLINADALDGLGF